MKGNPFLEITEMMKDFLSHQTNYVIQLACVARGVQSCVITVFHSKSIFCRQTRTEPKFVMDDNTRLF